LHGHRLLAPERAVVVEGGDSLGEPSFVTFSTKVMMLCFVGPSFQDGSGSAAKAALASNNRPSSALVSEPFI
jgi:hypothetical protein